jgi:hypothetical protein
LTQQDRIRKQRNAAISEQLKWNERTKPILAHDLNLSTPRLLSSSSLSRSCCIFGVCFVFLLSGRECVNKTARAREEKVNEIKEINVGWVLFDSRVVC